MPQRVEERVRPITPQLAWRVAVLGGLAFVLFAIVFFRLWYLQVLTGDQAVSKARDNRYRKVRIEAPRGDIVDRNNVKLVRTKPAAVVQLVPSQLPEAVREQADEYRQALAAAERDRLRARDRYQAFARQLRDDGRRSTKAERAELRRLRGLARRARTVEIPEAPASEPELLELYRRIGEVLRVRPKTIHERVIRGIADAPYSNVTIRTDVPLEQYNYMRERPEYFPGVVVAKRYLRRYPHGELAAQLFGTVSEITDEQLRMDEYKGIEQGTRIGQSGLEKRYDKYLRGVDGYSQVSVNAFGTRDEQRPIRVREPQQGQRLKLTIDYQLQKAGDEALERAIASSEFQTQAGAWIAMDPRDGAILGMGSKPGFDASVFAKPISQRTYNFLTSDETGAPLLNRVTESGYPTGSTFKPVTALAALEEGLINPRTTINDTGHLKVGTQEYQNAKGVSFGSINISDALKVSSDIFFFQLGAWANDRNRVIQRWAKRLGFGRKTGIDIPGEAAGLVPDARWRNSEYQEYKKCVEKAGLNEGTTAALFECGGIEKPWTPGDNVNLAVGQGDLHATPLQLAVAYAALANNGTIVRPHLGNAIEDGNGVKLQDLRFKPRRKIKFNPRDRQVVLDGLRRAANEEGGTSADVFAGWKGPTVYGKTGTAERYPNPDQAWYACFVKDTGRPIVVVVTIEKGGFGAATAAPAARMILSEWFDVADREFHAGSSVTR
ncbi:MAG TPA: penicillin-binding transpeptidase domain-containing protein [Solirubrobacter sp.]|nr:penicillin-binding transpeptidase domain-containing protein [Solirubrobacter sp.]